MYIDCVIQIITVYMLFPELATDRSAGVRHGSVVERYRIGCLRFRRQVWHSFEARYRIIYQGHSTQEVCGFLQSPVQPFGHEVSHVLQITK